MIRMVVRVRGSIFVDAVVLCWTMMMMSMTITVMALVEAMAMCLR